MLSTIKDHYKFWPLIQALIARQLALRYRGSFLGFLWSFLNPLMLMLIYTLVFKYYIRFESPTVGNYSIFLFCGLLPWIWLQSALMEGCSAVVSSGHLITKSMFPAQILPTVSVITAFIHYLLSLPLLFIFMLATGAEFHWQILALPILLLLQALFLLGIVWLVSALNVFYRDVQHLLGNIINFLFFLCPILYTSDTVPEAFRPLISLNPLALLTESYHQLILFGQWPALTTWLYLATWTLLLLLVGNWVFTRCKESFAEAL